MAIGDKTPIKWKDADFKWNVAPPSKDYKIGFKASSFPYTWNDVALVEVAIGAGGGGVMAEDMPWTKWSDEDDRKKRLVKLICKVQGKTITEEKEIQEYKITVKDIKLVAKEVLGVELTTENIKF